MNTGTTEIATHVSPATLINPFTGMTQISKHYGEKTASKKILAH